MPSIPGGPRFALAGPNTRDAQVVSSPNVADALQSTSANTNRIAIDVSRNLATRVSGSEDSPERKLRSDCRLFFLLCGGGGLALHRSLLLRGGLRLRRCLLHHAALLAKSRWRY